MKNPNWLSGQGQYKKRISYLKTSLIYVFMWYFQIVDLKNEDGTK